MKRPFQRVPSFSMVTLCAALGAGCAAGSSTPATATARSGQDFEANSGTQAPSARMERTLGDQARRISELEARIALLEQETRRRSSASISRETVRIGGARQARRAPEPEPALADSREPVAIVQLHEAPQRTAKPVPTTDWVLPSTPAGVPSELGVAPLPEERAGVAADPEDESAKEQYRKALGLLSEREFGQAYAVMDALTRTQPEHALVASATYWKGEAQYAQRRYREALAEFEQVLKRFSDSPKVPDALLKAGLCHMRLGQGELAARYFERVRRQFPASDAAKSAPREGST